MPGSSRYMDTLTLETFLRRQPHTPPANLFVALMISDPTDADTGTEVTYGGYARQIFAAGSVSSVGNRATCSNAGAIIFPQSTSPGGSVTHFAIRDALTGGNMLFYGPLQVTLQVNVGVEPRFDPGAITITAE